MTTVRFNPDLDCLSSDYLVENFKDLLSLAAMPS
jgi:hypothetical protein